MAKKRARGAGKHSRRGGTGSGSARTGAGRGIGRTKKLTKKAMRKRMEQMKGPVSPPPPSLPCKTQHLLLSGRDGKGRPWALYEPDYNAVTLFCDLLPTNFALWEPRMIARRAAAAEIRRLVALEKAVLASRQTCNTSTNTTPFTMQVTAPKIERDHIARSRKKVGKAKP